MDDLTVSATPAIHEDHGVYRAILESTDQAFCTIEVAFDESQKPVNYRFLEISSAFERETGIENATGRWMREIAPDQDQFWFDIYGRVALTGVSERFENYSTPLGRWFSVYALKIDGPARVAILFDDITDRKRAADALRNSEERYRTLFEAIDSGFCLIEMIFGEDGRATDYRFIETNPAFERQSGLIDAVGRRIREFAPDLEEHWFERYGHVALTGEPLRIEGEAAPLGRWFDINAFRAGPPEQHRVAVLFQDISERKQAETALQTSQEQFEALLNQAPLGVYLVDADFIIRQVNPIALPVFGDIPGGPIGRDFDEVMHILWDGTYADEVVGIFRHTLETGEPYVTPERAEYRIDRNITEYYEWRLDRIPLSGGRFGVVCYFRDISAQVWARQEIEQGAVALKENESRLQLLFDSIDEGFMEVEVTMSEDGRAVDWRYVSLNPAFKRLTGMEDVTGRLASEVFPDREPEWAERYAQIVTTGEPMRFELPAAAIGRWFDINLVNVGGAGTRRIAVVYDDITERKRAEAVLRENEARQAFLLNLSDTLRAEPNAEAVADRALGMLFAQLGLDRCYIGVFRLEEDRGEIPHQLHDESLPPMPTHVRLSDFPKAIEVASGQTLVIDDIREKEGLSDSDRTNIEALGMRAVVTATLRKVRNTPLWSIVVGSKEPRAWTQGEITLVEEVAERTWAAIERARTEAARVKADRSFTRLFEASPAPFLVLAPDQPKFTITEVNDAYLAATMRTRKDLVGCALFDAFPDNPNEPDPASVGRLRASLEQVLGSREPHALPGLKYDIPRPDGSFEERWWSPINSPILDEKGEVEAIIHNANDITQERHSKQHQELLLAELQHRVRNILTMVRSVARRTADNCENVDDYIRHLDGRLATLARMQTILTRDPGQGVNLYLLLLDELNSQAASPAQYELEGPDVELLPKAAEVLSLAIHELATNSIKYGVLSDSSGTVHIRWTTEKRDGQEWLKLKWNEPIKARPRPVRSGFGTELIKHRVPYELRGTGDIRFSLNLLEAVIAFPLVDEESMPQAAGASQGH